MPLFHCSKCHHEWEGAIKETTCDWCGSEGYIIQKDTPLEKLLKAWKSLYVKRRD